MASEFYNCILRASGNAPPGPGGGPPGGGRGGPGDDGNGDPPGDPCSESQVYIFCVPPTKYSEDNNDNCGGSTVFSKGGLVTDGTIPNCDSPFPNTIPGAPGGGSYFLPSEKLACEAQPFCNLNPIQCPAYACNASTGDPQNIPCDPTAPFDMESIVIGVCGDATDAGENSICPTAGQCVLDNGSTIYWSQDECNSDTTNACNDDGGTGPGDPPGECIGYTCTNADCPDGTCGPTIFTEDIDPCYSDCIAAQGDTFVCGDTGEVQYTDKQTCEESDDCSLVVECEYWECYSNNCTPDTIGWPDACVTKKTTNTDDDGNCGCDGRYTSSPGSGRYAEKNEALAACAKCNDGISCNTSNNLCELNENCVGTYSPGEGKCVYDGGCYDEDSRCYAETQCDGGDPEPCPTKWLCSWAPDYNCYECTGERDSDGNCQYTGTGDCTDADNGLGFLSQTACQFGNCLESQKCHSCISETSCDQNCDQVHTSDGSDCPVGCYFDPTECENKASEDCGVEFCYECVGDECLKTCQMVGGVCPPGCFTSPGCGIGCGDGEPPGGPGDSTGDGDGDSTPGGPGSPGTGESNSPETDDNGFTEADNNYIYAAGFVDEQYERNVNNRVYKGAGAFRPVPRGDVLDADLFEPLVHVSVKAVALMNAGSIEFSDMPYHDLGDSVLEQSLNQNIVAKYKKAKKANGKFMIKSLLSQVREGLVSSRTDQISAKDLNTIADALLKAQEDPEYLDTRGSEPNFSYSYGSESEAVSLALNNAYPLYYDEYEDKRANEDMKLWKTIASDLDKHLVVRSGDGSTTKLMISDDDSFILKTDAGENKAYISDGDRYNYTLRDGAPAQLVVSGTQERGAILTNEYIQKVCDLLGEEYKVTLNCSTLDTDLIEEGYGTGGERRDVFFMKLDPSTLTDESSSNSFLRKTRARYEVITNESERDAWVKTKPFPYLIFYVDADDPILSFVSHEGQAHLNYMDFTFDQFSDFNNELPVFPRKLPWYILLIPTDITANLVNHKISRFVSYGTRELLLEMHVDPSRADESSPTHVDKYYPYPDKGVFIEEDNPQAVFYTYQKADTEDEPAYQNGSMPDVPRLPRPNFGVKQVLASLYDMKTVYDLGTDNVATWEEVYELVDNGMMKYLNYEVKDWEQVKNQFNRGKISSDDTVNARYARTKDVRSTGLPIRTDASGVGTSRRTLQKIDDNIEPAGPQEFAP